MDEKDTNQNRNGSALNSDIKKRSTQEENAVFDIISNLLPAARENDDRIRDFYIQVKKVHGKDLDDNLWMLFLMDTVIATTVTTITRTIII